MLAKQGYKISAVIETNINVFRGDFYKNTESLFANLYSSFWNEHVADETEAS